jgi:hypothetical protein
MYPCSGLTSAPVVANFPTEVPRRGSSRFDFDDVLFEWYVLAASCQGEVRQNRGYYKLGWSGFRLVQAEFQYR